jgi:O-acetyl-ADP-ribose deacetylase (regulator of RNase III)
MAEIALQAIRDFENIAAFDKIIFVCFDEENYEIYQKLSSPLNPAL